MEKDRNNYSYNCTVGRLILLGLFLSGCSRTAETTAPETELLDRRSPVVLCPIPPTGEHEHPFVMMVFSNQFGSREVGVEIQPFSGSEQTAPEMDGGLPETNGLVRTGINMSIQIGVVEDGTPIVVNLEQCVVTGEELDQLENFFDGIANPDFKTGYDGQPKSQQRGWVNPGKRGNNPFAGLPSYPNTLVGPNF